MKKILVADDQPEIRYLISCILQREGYEVIEAQDGDSAFKKMVELKPDLAILDVAMPLIDGLTLLSKVKTHESTKKIPIIIISSYDDLINVAMDEKIRPDEIVDKLSLYQDLVEKVKKLI